MEKTVSVEDLKTLQEDLASIQKEAEETLVKQKNKTNIIIIILSVIVISAFIFSGLTDRFSGLSLGLGLIIMMLSFGFLIDKMNQCLLYEENLKLKIVDLLRSNHYARYLWSLRKDVQTLGLIGYTKDMNDSLFPKNVLESLTKARNNVMNQIISSGTLISLKSENLSKVEKIYIDSVVETTLDKLINGSNSAELLKSLTLSEYSNSKYKEALMNILGHLIIKTANNEYAYEDKDAHSTVIKLIKAQISYLDSISK